MGMDQPPPPPPAGGSKPPDWGEMSGKLKAARGPDRLIMIAGALFFVDSFFPWLGVKASIGGVTIFSVNVKGWSSGGLAVIAILLAIAATVVATLEVIGQMKDVGMPAGQLQLALCGGAFAFTLIRWLTELSLAKWGIYVALVLGAVMTYGAYQKFQTSKAVA